MGMETEMDEGLESMGVGKVGGGRGKLDSTKAGTNRSYSEGWLVHWCQFIIWRSKLTLVINFSEN